MRMRDKLKPNLLLVLLFAYTLIGVCFAVMVINGTKPADAYEAVHVPFVALIGGTLSIAKDLL